MAKKHSRWEPLIEKDSWGEYVAAWECPECKDAWMLELEDDDNPAAHNYNFCPNCGVRLVEEVDDE